MFTGIIKATAKLISTGSAGGMKQLRIQRPPALPVPEIGASIACDGICLTVVAFDHNSFTVEVMNETAAKTTASNWKPGTLLNLEPALRMGDPLDGHWVQGHIDRTARLLEKKVINATTYLRFELDSRDGRLVAPQGSIAVNGVSLTIADLASNSFTVALIGHTLANTNLSLLPSGGEVNLEYDILGKYLARLQTNRPLTAEDLL
jgi:riboflavin synthase